MSQCAGFTKTGSKCVRIIKNNQQFCWQHTPTITNNIQVNSNSIVTQSAVKNSGSGRALRDRKIGNFTLFDTVDHQLWEAEYQRIMNIKYAKGTRNFNTTLTGNPWLGEGQPPIFLVPRVRGGAGYKSVKFQGVTSDDVVYAPISKGFSMQDVSSFTLGPIVGEGLCLVNAAFSKSICIMHIEGGGRLDLGRKNFWRRARTPERVIQVIDDIYMSVNGQKVIIHEWLAYNEEIWLPEWELWRKSIALSSMGDFHWTDNSPTIAYRYQGKYLNFVQWKRECYVRPSYNLLPSTTVIQFLWIIWNTHRRPLGLVHPKAITDHAEAPITKEHIQQLYDSPHEMCCQPFVIAGFLLGVAI